MIDLRHHNRCFVPRLYISILLVMGIFSIVGNLFLSKTRYTPNRRFLDFYIIWKPAIGWICASKPHRIIIINSRNEQSAHMSWRLARLYGPQRCPNDSVPQISIGHEEKCEWITSIAVHWSVRPMHCQCHKWRRSLHLHLDMKTKLFDSIGTDAPASCLFLLTVIDHSALSTVRQATVLACTVVESIAFTALTQQQPQTSLNSTLVTVSNTAIIALSGTRKSTV